MLTAAGLITDCTQAAHVPGFTAQALDYLNAVLSDLAENRDLAVARQTYSFNLNPSLSSLYGSGPYPLPLDYLRTSGSSGSYGTQHSAWYVYNGIPYFLIPDDLAQFDAQIQVSGIQSLPGRLFTDVSPIRSRIQVTTTADVTLGSTALAVVSGTGISSGQSIAGDGIAPGSTIVSGSGTSWVMSLPATATYTGASGHAGTGAASVFLGIPANAYVYPPPLGSYPTTIRYQYLPPPIQDTARYPWFPSEGYLMDALTGRLCVHADDSRAASEFLGDGTREGRADRRLREYMQLADDKTNRAETVVLDSRRFGPRERSLKPVKNAGW